MQSVCGWSESDDHMRISIELRKAKRYWLNAPAHFMWAPKNGKPQSGQGLTRDINTSGVFVVTDAIPPVGARVQMEIVLPKLKDAGPGMRLEGEGIVLRCNRGDAAKCGFAASVQFYPEATDAVLSQLRASGQVA
jgi:hypothetical protein